MQQKSLRHLFFALYFHSCCSAAKMFQDYFSARAIFFVYFIWRFNMITAEQIVTAQKASLETIFGLNQKTFEAVEKLIQLNVQAAKAAMTEAATHSQAVLAVKDAQELLALQTSLMQPLAEKTVAYGRSVYEITSGTGAEVAKAVEAQATEVQSKIMAVVDNAAKNAPAGSETAVAVVKSAVNAANNAIESVQKVVKQATEMAEANFNTVTATAVNAAKTSTATAKRRS
jgi:phasin family protein